MMQSQIASTTERAEVIQAVKWCVERQLPLRRPTPHLLKVGALNYWPAKGTVMFDGEQYPAGKGFEAFKSIVLRMKDL